MRKMIKLDSGSSDPILVGVDIPADEVRDKIHDVGWLDLFKGEPEAVSKNYGTISKMIVAYSRPILASFEELQKEKIPLTSASAEFGLSFNGKGDIFLLEASAEASIKVSLEWSLEAKK